MLSTLNFADSFMITELFCVQNVANVICNAILFYKRHSYPEISVGFGLPVMTNYDPTDPTPTQVQRYTFPVLFRSKNQDGRLFSMFALNSL